MIFEQTTPHRTNHTFEMKLEKIETTDYKRINDLNYIVRILTCKEMKNVKQNFPFHLIGLKDFRLYLK